MSEEPRHQTSRAGVIVLLVAVGGSAIGVLGWHLMSNRKEGLDTSGFDMSSAPDPSKSQAPPFFAPSAVSAPAPVQQTSLGMVKADAGMSVVSPGSSTPKPQAASGAAKTSGPKEDAVLSFKEAAIKYEKAVGDYVRKMQARYPSIGQYGKDWAASPQLRALRDQYWKDRDPLKFAYGLAKSDDFGKLIKKYGADPGIRATLTEGIKAAPPGLMSAAGGLAQNDGVVKDLAVTAIKAVGLPASLTGFLTGADVAAPDQNKIMSDIMNSAEGRKAMQGQNAPAVSLPDKDKEPAQTNGFTPLGSRR